jgi:hypothetical protein
MGHPYCHALLSALALVLGLLTVGVEAFNFIDATPPHRLWKTTGCEAFDVIDIYNGIHSALRYEQRDIYVSINSDWMNKFMLEDTKVDVTCIDVSKLETLKVDEKPEPHISGTGRRWVPSLHQKD